MTKVLQELTKDKDNTAPPAGKRSAQEPAPWSPSSVRPRSHEPSTTTCRERAASSSTVPSAGNPGSGPLPPCSCSWLS